jgi:hypothetical protein
MHQREIERCAVGVLLVACSVAAFQCFAAATESAKEPEASTTGSLVVDLAAKGELKKANQLLAQTCTKLTNDCVETMLTVSRYYFDEDFSAGLTQHFLSFSDDLIPHLVRARTHPKACDPKHAKFCRARERYVEWLGKVLAELKCGTARAEDGERTTYLDKKFESIEKTQVATIRIFLDDFKERYGEYPGSLARLRDSVWDEYGFKLVICRPSGEKYQYSTSEGGKKFRLSGGKND